MSYIQTYDIYDSMRAQHVDVIRERAEQSGVDLKLTGACIDIEGKTALCFRGKLIQPIIDVIRDCSPHALVYSHYCDSDGELEVRVVMPSDTDLWIYSKTKTRFHPFVQCVGITAIVLIIGGVGGLAALL